MRKSFGCCVGEVTHSSVIFRHLQTYMTGFVCEQKKIENVHRALSQSIHRSKNARSPTGSQHEEGWEGGSICRISPALESRCACSTCQFPRRETGIIATCHSQVNSPPSLCSGEQSMLFIVECWHSVFCIQTTRSANMSNLNKSYI